MFEMSWTQNLLNKTSYSRFFLSEFCNFQFCSLKKENESDKTKTINPDHFPWISEDVRDLGKSLKQPSLNYLGLWQEFSFVL